MQTPRPFTPRCAARFNSISPPLPSTCKRIRHSERIARCNPIERFAGPSLVPHPGLLCWRGLLGKRTFVCWTHGTPPNRRGRLETGRQHGGSWARTPHQREAMAGPAEQPGCRIHVRASPAPLPPSRARFWLLSIAPHGSASRRGARLPPSQGQLTPLCTAISGNEFQLMEALAAGGGSLVDANHMGRSAGTAIGEGWLVPSQLEL